MPDKRPVDGSGDEERHPVLEDHGYRILKMLGKGSYASVKLAYSDRHQTNVAVKIIKKRDAPVEYLDKFLPREISIVKMLKHPNLIVFLQVCWSLHQFSIIIIAIIIIIIFFFFFFFFFVVVVIVVIIIIIIINNNNNNII